MQAGKGTSESVKVISGPAEPQAKPPHSLKLACLLQETIPGSVPSMLGRHRGFSVHRSLHWECA